MDNMTGKHIFVFLAGAAAGALAMHLDMKVNGPARRAQQVINELVQVEAVKGLTSWY